MMLNALNIPSLSQALNSLDSAFLSSSAIVPTIQSALIRLNCAMREESFVNSRIVCHSNQYILEEYALHHSLHLLTSTLADVQLRLTALKQSITSLVVVVPSSLSDSKEILTALHLAVCGPQINWSLVNKAFNSFVSLATEDSITLDIQSRRRFVVDISEGDFVVYVKKILRSGSAEMSTSLKSLNKVIGHFKDDLRCNSLLFDTLVNLLVQLQSPAIAQKEKLLVLLINKYQSRQIGDDSIRLIYDFLYSHKKAVIIASSTLEIFRNLSSSNKNKALFFSHTSVSTALITTINNHQRDRNICHHGCELVYYLTVDHNNESEGCNFLDAVICEVLIQIKKIHIHDEHINSLVSSIIKYKYSLSDQFSLRECRRIHFFILFSLLAISCLIGLFFDPTSAHFNSLISPRYYYFYLTMFCLTFFELFPYLQIDRISYPIYLVLTIAAIKLYSRSLFADEFREATANIIFIYSTLSTAILARSAQVDRMSPFTFGLLTFFSFMTIILLLTKIL